METDLQEVLNKLNERILSIDNFIAEEAKFGLFMLEHNARIIPISEVSRFVLIDGMMALQGLKAMRVHFVNWSNYINKEISKTDSILNEQTIE